MAGRSIRPRTLFDGYIDDATSKVYARFYEYEGVYPILDSMIRFTKRNGVPKAVYVDRHSTYKTTRKASHAELLCDTGALTQFQSVMKDCGIKVIHARSPQAKGRADRLFLIKNPSITLKGQAVEIRQDLNGEIRVASSSKLLAVKECFEPPKTQKMHKMSMAESKRRLQNTRNALEGPTSKQSWLDDLHFNQRPSKSTVLSSTS